MNTTGTMLPKYKESHFCTLNNTVEYRNHLIFAYKTYKSEYLQLLSQLQLTKTGTLLPKLSLNKIHTEDKKLKEQNK